MDWNQAGNKERGDCGNSADGERLSYLAPTKPGNANEVTAVEQDGENNGVADYANVGSNS